MCFFPLCSLAEHIEVDNIYFCFSLFVPGELQIFSYRSFEGLCFFIVRESLCFFIRGQFTMVFLVFSCASTFRTLPIRLRDTVSFRVRDYTL